MEIIRRFVTQNSMYKSYTKIPVRKLVLHSVGCAQPNAEVFARSWQTARYFAHAVLQADGTVYQVMPWDYLCYHVGAANAYSIGVEMTEPDCIRYTGGATFVCSDWNRAAAQVEGTYRTAVELFAKLCEEFGLDPYKDIMSHNEAGKMGIGTDHVDPEHLWKQLGMGYTMDGFRQDVYNALNNNDEEGEENMMKYNTIDEIPDWARGAVRKLIDAGALAGEGDGKLNLSYEMLRGIVIGTRYAEACNPHYETIDDVPEWAREDVQSFVDQGALAGEDGGKLNLSRDMLRCMIINKRYCDKTNG